MHRKPNTEALLERARLMCNPPTWYQLAKRTGIKATTLSRCMVQHKTLGDINAWKLARFLGMDPKEIMAYMAEDRAQDEPTKTFWGGQLPRLFSSAAIAAALILGAAGGALADERGSTASTVAISPAIYYAKLLVKLAIRRVRDLAASLGASTRSPPTASAAA